MSADRFEFRISFRKLLIGLAITLIPISLAGLYSLTSSERGLERAIGGHFRAISESTAAEVSLVIHELGREVSMIASDPLVNESVQLSNRSYGSQTDEAVSARITQIDKQWTTGQADPIVKEMLASGASRSLRRHRELDSRILRITVTDSKGATVAATHKTLDYYQADEAYWQAIYAQGRGAVNITDLLYDEVTKSNYLGVGVPVLEEGTNRFIGTLDALVDVSSLAPILSRLQIGPTGRALLVKDDGTIIAGPQINLAMNLKSQEFAALEDARQSGAHSGPTGFLTADLPALGGQLIGYADTGLRRDYGNLGWYVLVSQSTQEAFAPVRAVDRMIAFLSLLGIVMVTLLAVYFSLHRRERIEDIAAAMTESEERDRNREAAKAGAR